MKMMNLTAVVVLLTSALAQADSSLGTKEETDLLAAEIVRIIDEKGMDRAVQALVDPAMPFASTRQGVNLFDGSIIVGDNREPEMVRADYADLTDLNGALMWKLISEAAPENAEVVIKWYHYDTQEVYDYSCLARNAADPRFTVMVCR